MTARSSVRRPRVPSLVTPSTHRRLFHSESLEQRTLLCAIPADQMVAAPAFDWNIERNAQAIRAAQSAGHGAAADSGTPNSGTGDAVSIIWTNRGAASDGFAAAFGASANAGRAVIDGLFARWAQIITSWNRADGTTTLQVTVTVQNNAGGFGASAGPGNNPGDGKPRTGAITLGSGNNSADPNDSNGFFFDPTPMDDSEFLGAIRHGFNSTATNPGQGADLFSLANAEFAHVMGLISDANNAGGGYQGYRLENFTTATGIRDNAEGGGSFGFFYVFDGTTVDHLFTSYNSGSPSSASWGNVVHSAGPSTITFNSRQWTGADDEGNAIYNPSERMMPSYVIAHMLSDAYGYSIIEPATFHTAYTVLNQSTGVLTVRGSPSATSSDTIVIDSSGTDLVVSVDIGEDVAGTGSLSSAGDLGFFVTRIPLSSITSINVDGGGARDYLRVQNVSGKSLTIHGGAGDDYIDLSFYGANLDSTPTGSITLFGDAGSDNVFVYDNNNTRADTYTITSARFDRPGWAGFSYAADIEGLTLTTGTAANVVNVPSTFAAQPIYLYSAGGGDTVNIGNTTNGLESINADVYVNNTPSFSTVNINDGPDTTADTATVAYSGAYGYVSGLAPATIYWNRSDIAAITMTTGSAADVVNVLANSETLNLTTSGGGDTVNLGNQNLFTGDGLDSMTGFITLSNPPSFTTLFVTDLYGTAARNASWAVAGGFTTITGLQPAGYIRYTNNDTNSVNVQGGSLADTFTFADFYRNTTVNGGGGNDTMNVNSTASGWSLTLDAGTGDDTINVNEATVYVNVQTGIGAGDVLTVNSDNTGTAYARMNASDGVSYLNLGTGGRLDLTAGRNKALSIDNANIGGVLDLADNALIDTQVVGPANESFFRSRLITGRNGGLWNGPQPAFVSTVAAASALNDGLGYGYAGTEVLPGFSSLYGLPIANGDLIIRYALNGDANLDGTVNFNDLLTVAQNYGATGRRWSQGDFDYDGTVGFNDLLSLAQNYSLGLLESDWARATGASSRTRPEASNAVIALRSGRGPVDGTRLTDVQLPSERRRNGGTFSNAAIDASILA